MDEGRGHQRRWSNVPIPEPHVAGLIGGTALQLVKPWRVFDTQYVTRATGVGLVGVALLVIERTVRTIGNQRIERPTALVTAGPYAYSRNPMYVAWTALYLGVALLANTMWLFVGFPVVVATTHWLVRREERSLESALGDEYRAYHRDVPRYL